MSLYYDAASILTSQTKQGSLKSRIYAKDAQLKSKPSHIYALISESAKYDVFLAEVIDNAELLASEPKLNPLLALLLVHDHFFAKGGIAAGSSHPLRLSIERHKARLQSEFTKARLKRRIPTVEQLKGAISKEKGIVGRTHPRWARVNSLKSSLEDVVRKYFANYREVTTIDEVSAGERSAKLLHRDRHIPNLLAFPPDTDLTKHPAYVNGEIILQDKASCFPAYLLVGEHGRDNIGGAIDGCAAPGNKTTHLAALVQSNADIVYACERDATRSKTLQMMVDKAGATNVVTVLQKQDFLALDPQDTKFASVTHLLLDPSCSGSGILGREDIPDLVLPKDPRKKTADQQNTSNPKKRKREVVKLAADNKGDKAPTTVPLELEAEQQPLEATKERLEKLSNLQSRIVEHAFKFPAARCVTYSTCSIHVEENEAVVFRVLNSAVGKSRRWRVMKREEQVHGMRTWPHRGVNGDHGLDETQREACIRCTPDDGEGTMGFFVCGFVRDTSEEDTGASHNGVILSEDGGDGEWEGFSDS